MTFQPEPYRPRTVRSFGTLDADGWCLKRYAVTLRDEPFEPEVWASIPETVRAALPRPARTRDRPGLGFLIHHQGRGAHYAVLAWWDRENELFTRVWCRRRETGAAWRPATAGETACVWDLQIFAWERDAYVATMLGSGGPRPDAYTARIRAGQV